MIDEGEYDKALFIIERDLPTIFFEDLVSTRIIWSVIQMKLHEALASEGASLAILRYGNLTTSLCKLEQFFVQRDVELGEGLVAPTQPFLDYLHAFVTEHVGGTDTQARQSQAEVERILRDPVQEQPVYIVCLDGITYILHHIASIIVECSDEYLEYFQAADYLEMLKKIADVTDRSLEKILTALTNAIDLPGLLMRIQMSTAAGLDESQEQASEQKRDDELRALVSPILDSISLLSHAVELFTALLDRYWRLGLKMLATEQAGQTLLAQSTRLLQELTTFYVPLEQNFLSANLQTALRDIQGKATVEDCFFLLKKVRDRALNTRNSTAVVSVLHRFPLYLDELLLPRFQHYMDSAQSAFRRNFSGAVDEGILSALSTLDLACTYLKAFLQTTSQELAETFRSKELLKVQAIVAEIDVQPLLSLRQRNLDRYLTVAIFPALQLDLEGFARVNFAIDEQAFRDYEFEDPFMQRFLASLLAQLQPLREPLGPKLFGLLGDTVLKFASDALAKAVFGLPTISQFGAFQLEKDIRLLVDGTDTLSASTSRAVFLRLLHISRIVAFEDPNDLKDLWSVEKWRLSLTEIRRLWAKRQDFDPSAVAAVVDWLQLSAIVGADTEPVTPVLRAVEQVAEPPLGSQVAMPHSYFVPLPPDWTSASEESALPHEIVSLDLDTSAPFSLAQLPALPSAPAPVPVSPPALSTPSPTPAPAPSRPKAIASRQAEASRYFPSQLSSVSPWQPPANGVSPALDFFGESSGDFLADLQSLKTEVTPAPAPLLEVVAPKPSIAPVQSPAVQPEPFQAPFQSPSSSSGPALADSLFGDSSGDFLSSLTQVTGPPIVESVAHLIPAPVQSPPPLPVQPAVASQPASTPAPTLQTFPVVSTSPVSAQPAPPPPDLFAQSSNDFLSFLQAPAAALQPTTGAKAELVEYLFGPNSTSELPDASSLF